MKKLSFFAAFFFLTVSGFLSCKKEHSCEGCKNKPPIAAAGPDTVITLPTDSALLDGSNFSGPDGSISEWRWTKVAGPASFGFSNPTTAKQNRYVVTEVPGSSENVGGWSFKKFLS